MYICYKVIVAVAGDTNVGKSSLVGVLCTGKINIYYMYVYKH
jgi:GTPase